MTSQGNSLITCIIFMCICFFAFGCDQYTRKKILVFLFPPSAKEKQEVTAKEDMEKLSPNLKNKVSPKSAFFAHGPKAQGQCHQCHEASGTYSFRKTDKKGAGDQSSGEGGVSGRLVMPLSELCADCHTSKSQKAAFADGLWLHGPVAQGECTLCHQPHQSEFQYMLLKKNSVELCVECHASGYMKESEEHKTGAECTLCHNPHAGKDNLLLKQDYNELF